MNVRRLVVLATLTLFPACAIAAEIAPPAQSPKCEKPSASDVPAIPPSRIDPGIQRTPETGADPGGSVKPPNLDPGISKNPDVAPPPREGINPPDGAKPKEKPGVH